MNRGEVKLAAKAEYEKIRAESKAYLRYDGMDNPCWRQYFKNGAAFGYELAMKEQVEALKKATQEISIASL